MGQKILQDVKRSVRGWLSKNPNAEPTVMALAFARSLGIPVDARVSLRNEGKRARQSES